VLFIIAHDQEQGAHGLIINRPTGKTVADLLSSHDMGMLATLPVFIGGPVAGDQLTFASFHSQKSGQIIECRPHLGLEEARELAGEKSASVRAFIGYSGWSVNQLETELGQKAWIVRDPDMDAFDISKTGELWPSIMRSMGPWFRLLSAAPDDPSRN